jgi:hypothetical protein
MVYLAGFLLVACIWRNACLSFDWFWSTVRPRFRGGDHNVGTRHYVVQRLSIFFFIQQKIGDVEKGVAFQPDIDKGGLHAGKHAGHTPFINGTCKRVFVLTLKINFCELIFFDNRNFRLMRCRRDKQFFGHASLRFLRTGRRIRIQSANRVRPGPRSVR